MPTSYRFPVIALIIAFDKVIPLVNALVLRNLFEYLHQSYIAESHSHWATFSSQTL